MLKTTYRFICGLFYSVDIRDIRKQLSEKEFCQKYCPVGISPVNCSYHFQSYLSGNSILADYV